MPEHAVACQVRSPVILTGRMKTDSNARENPSSLWETQAETGYTDYKNRQKAENLFEYIII